MQDRVAEVLAQRSRLDRGGALPLFLSVVLHAALGSAAVYGALHAKAPAPATMVSIQFARMPGAAPAPARTIAAPPQPRPETPRIEPPKPVIKEPQPAVTPAPQPEKNTVPMSPFGRSTKKGSENPAAEPPSPPAMPAGVEALSPSDVPIGGSGVAGLEGGDFPYTLYIDGMHRRIGANWFRPQVPPGTAVVIYYRIQRDGTITDTRVETPSGNSTFDRAALSAVRSSSPLNPLPFGYAGNYLGVHLIFR